MSNDETNKPEEANEDRNRIADMYDLKRFEESDFSKIKKSFHSCKAKMSQNIKDPKTYKNFLFSKLPFLSWLPKYNIKEFLLLDMVAGLTVGVMNIPQVF